MFETREEIMHKFCFHPSNELIQLTQQLLTHIHLLNECVENADNFPSLQTNSHRDALDKPTPSD